MQSAQRLPYNVDMITEVITGNLDNRGQIKDTSFYPEYFTDNKRMRQESVIVGLCRDLGLILDRVVLAMR